MENILKPKYLKQAKKPVKEEEQPQEKEKKHWLDELFGIKPEQLDPTRPNVEYEINEKGEYVKKDKSKKDK